MGIPISNDHTEELTRELCNLLILDVLFSYDARMPRWRSIFKRKDFMTYLEWCNDLNDHFFKFFDVSPRSVL